MSELLLKHAPAEWQGADVSTLIPIAYLPSVLSSSWGISKPNHACCISFVQSRRKNDFSEAEILTVAKVMPRKALMFATFPLH